MHLIVRCGPAVLAAFLAASCAHRPPMVVQTTPASCRQVVPETAQAVRWVAPDHPRDINHHIAWCRTVGPLVVSAPDQIAVTPALTGQFAVVSWNVHVGAGDIEGFVDRLRRGEFTGGVPVVNFALLIQEAYRAGPDVPQAIPDNAPVPRPIVGTMRDGARRDVRMVAARTGLHLFYAPSMRNGAMAAPEDRGSAILSTVPLTDLQAIELPFERQRRVALAATLAGTTASGEPWRLRVADVHVDTSLALTRGGPFAARKRQIEGLIEALALAGVDSSTPTIVGGDFNTWLGPKEPALAVMRRVFSDTARLLGTAGPPGFTAASTWRGPLGLRAAVDYVFARGAFVAGTTRRLPDRFGSDHHPLLTLLDIQGGRAPQRSPLESVE